jgi:histidinol-phosphate/aromatic aminotransferase/cobyric acid decarboxylase-like protein
VTRNAAGFVDAPCVSYYRVIRDGARQDARQIGYGVNKRPVHSVVARQIQRVHAQLLAGRITDYDHADDIGCRALVATLASRYLGMTGLTAEHVVLSHGTTEAISIVFNYASVRKLRPVVPVPNYYAFEHSAARAGLPGPVHYQVDGTATGSLGGPATAGDLLVDVAPNGVLGSWFTTPPEVRPALRLVDHVFALPSFQPHRDVRAELAARCGSLAETVVCLSPSKDLSIPGLRCGVMVTQDPDLLAYAAADRFERGYAVHAAVAPVAATHLALLLICAADHDEVAATYRELVADFAQAGIPFITSEDAEEIFRWSALERAAFMTNLAEYDRRPFLLPVRGAESPVAGYSTFRWLDGPFRSPHAFTDWAREAGRLGLKLNPNNLFGGNDDVWARLYPGRHGIRLNLSVDPVDLRADLDLLAAVLPTDGGGGRRA